MLRFLSSARHTEERGLVVILDVPENAPRSEMGALQKDAQEFLMQILPDLPRISVVLTAERKAASNDHAGHSHGAADQVKLDLPDIRHIIAVSSGKGGVGKSAVSNNLAAALARQGYAVGLLDADIHGPSQPHMTGTQGARAVLGGDRKIIPQQAHGVKTMSIGYLLENQGPVVWRGPMVQRALIQMLRDVAWGKLDVLVLDLPPGTGDIPLTLSQKVPLTGAIVVSTPQDIALLDAMKGLEMFQKLDVPVLGLIENMSMFSCPHCGGETHLFGHGGAKREAEKRGLPLLGEIPLSLEIREAADAGRITEGDSRKAFEAVAERLSDILELEQPAKKAV
ncbi:MAG: MRP family ATP-binding protein [Alphaproteobacteria bacterium]|nr:MAG: MRP family ATP-binding protein [Alphaproteobacteria bacterium]